MPVIGRLNEQVNDVLIDPIGKRRTRDDGDAPHAPANDSRRDATDDDATDNDATSDAARDDDARRAHSEKARTHVENDDTRAGDDEQLPVWLL
jgi:hypothetical protein